MRILQIMPQFPWPATDGGKIGIVNISREFTAQGHHVHVFAVSAEEPAPERRAEALRDVAGLTVVQAATRNSPANIAASLLSRLPLYVWKYYRASVRQALAALCAAQEFDVIHADHSSMIPLGLEAQKRLGGIPLGLRLHNVEWIIWQRYAERFAPYRPERWYAALQAARLRRFEAQHYARMDVCFAITPDDRERAGAMQPRGRYLIAGAGVNLAEWQPRPDTVRRPGALVLATTFNWVHNVEAAHWLIAQVLPLVREHVPEVHLNLIGKNPPASLQKLHGGPLNVTGFVERVQPWLETAQVYCAPLFVGGGIRIKILEAMAMELPVVATSISAEGISATEADGLFRADTAADFAATVRVLCAESATARRAGQAARAYVEQHYTWRRNVGRMLAEYTRLLEQRSTQER